MKRQRIGTVRLQEGGDILHYYLLGSRREGYGLEVVRHVSGQMTRERCEKISRNRQKVLTLGKAVFRGIVFPGFLSEIVEEWK